MNKFFTSLFMLGLALTGAAQSVQVQKGADGSVVYPNGSVINVAPATITTGTSTRYVWDPELHIKAINTCWVTVTASCTPEDNNVQFCGINGSCILLSSGEVTKSTTMNAGQVENLEIDIARRPQLITENQTCTITIDADGEVTTITVNFLKDNTDIASVEAAAQAVSVKGRVLTYAFDTPTQLALYTISGQPAICRTLSGNGTLSLEALPAGVYVYRAGSHTGKFIVR